MTYDASDDVWQKSLALPAKNYEYKVALNGMWDENYGAHAQFNGANVSFSLGAGATVKFYYDNKSHWVTDNRSSVIVVAAGSLQSELGCPGDWDPSCLRSWLQDVDGDGTYTMTTTSLPAGTYETKAAIDESWDSELRAWRCRERFEHCVRRFDTRAGDHVPIRRSNACSHYSWGYRATNVDSYAHSHGDADGHADNSFRHDQFDSAPDLNSRSPRDTHRRPATSSRFSNSNTNTNPQGQAARAGSRCPKLGFSRTPVSRPATVNRQQAHRRRTSPSEGAAHSRGQSNRSGRRHRPARPHRRPGRVTRTDGRSS